MGILRSSNERDVTKMGHAGRRERARRTGKRNKENGNKFNLGLRFNRGTQREYSSKPLKHIIDEGILVFKR